MNLIWTKPYYGVSHLELPDRRYQITVEQHATWAEVAIFNLLHCPFGVGCQTKIFTDPSAAREYGESKARELYQ